MMRCGGLIFSPVYPIHSNFIRLSLMHGLIPITLESRIIGGVGIIGGLGIVIIVNNRGGGGLDGVEKIV